MTDQYISGIVASGMKKLYAFILALTLLIGISPNLTFAQTPNNVRREENVLLQKDEVVNDDYFATGDAVKIEGTVNGDVFAAAGQTTIEGTINGDVLAASGQVTISGPINGDVRIAGGDVILSSPVDGNVTILSGNLLVEENATISGSLNGMIGNARILSTVGKSMHVSGGQITLGSTVEKNVKAAVGKMSLINGAHIKGDLIYISDEDLDISGGALVDGATVEKVLPEQIETRESESKGALFGLIGFGTIFWLINAFIFGALLLGLAPRYTSNVIESMRSRFWMNLLVGFVFLVVLPIVIVILLITVFGIPLALLASVAYLILICLGKIMFALFLGTKAQKYISFAKNKYVVLLLGLIIYSILTWIPLIGWIIGMIGSLAGIGAILVTKKDIYNQMRSKKLI